jgi:putative phosphoribosyl transferase
VRPAYADRLDAGRVLGTAVREALGRDPPCGTPPSLVLGLPRGGVPVAVGVARAMNARLDVIVVRKLGLPGRPELAMGAIADVGDSVEIIRNEAVVTRGSVPPEAFDDVYRREVLELRRRVAAYRGSRVAAPVHDRTVIVVDDGLATGSTMRAAVAAVRRGGPARLVVAVPVGSPAVCDALRRVADEVICALTPESFLAVGQAYRDFAQTTDEEVGEILDGYSV